MLICCSKIHLCSQIVRVFFENALGLLRKFANNLRRNCEADPTVGRSRLEQTFEIRILKQQDLSGAIQLTKLASSNDAPYRSSYFLYKLYLPLIIRHMRILELLLRGFPGIYLLVALFVHGVVCLVEYIHAFIVLLHRFVICINIFFSSAAG